MNRLTHSLVVIAMLVGHAVTVVAAEFSGAPVVNDPTRASQKPLFKPEFEDLNKHNGFQLPPAPEKSEPAVSGGQVTIKQIIFSGNQVFSNTDLQKISQSYLNRPLQVSDLEELREKLTAVYTNAGYVNSGAIIPSQSTASGQLLVNITEGNLSEIRLQGMERLRESYVRDRLQLAAGSPLNLKNLQQGYQRLLASPLIERMNGSLLPGAKLGESVLLVKVARERPYQLYAASDNYTTPLIGGYAGRIGGWVDNLSGFGERLDAEFMATGGALGVNAGIDVPLNAYDTHATFRYSNTSTKLIDNIILPLDIQTNVIGYEGGFSHPVYRSAGIDLKMGANFAVRESHSTQGGAAGSFTEGLRTDQGTTQVSVLRLWQQLVHQGDNNAFVLRSTFNKGLDVFGATIQNDSMLPSAAFFSWLGQSQYLHKVMDNGAQVVVRGALQLSEDPLLSLEKFSVGGVYSVRGYRENNYVRDNGFNTSIEFRYPLFGGDSDAKHSLFLIPFMDYGGAWNNPTLGTQLPNQHAKDYLHSVGIGFNWHYEHVNTEFYWAHAITQVRINNAEHNIQDDGLHFKVSLSAF